ncbi:hypothetical protein IGI04_007286 [Brassica rapa subsp. trilocularis]|uniref:Uncharacterized protein n=1 Tax=Brassica rapa subsp. trilocularis TaxID=1813537 RepID=A0ABQ7NJB0_BRACM|nr:hypothetical protein IGI04_007286 [Brassica rapa subsp. trilocularis]
MTTEIKQISKSVAKITSALTRRLPIKSSTARRLPMLLQAHIISNESDPPIIVSFYDFMNHKNVKSKSWVFLAQCGEKVRDMLCLVHKIEKRRRVIDDNGNLVIT